MKFLGVFAISLFLHGVLLAALFAFRSPFPIAQRADTFISVALDSKGKLDQGRHTRDERTALKGKGSSAGQGAGGLDLRPNYMKHGHPVASGVGGAGPSVGPGLNEDAQAMLNTETRVQETFDLLAERIGQELDYPVILAENGVQGIASLDLFFDDEGNVDERRSTFQGSHRALRGLLTRAARKGITDWFIHDADRLHKRELRNQYFQADFVVTSVLPHMGPGVESSRASRRRVSLGRYHFIRERSFSCATLGGVDLVCAAIRAGGAVKNLFSNEQKLRFAALVDRLGYFDELGLSGLNSKIAHERGKAS